VGGSAFEWSTAIDADVPAGAALTLRLVMTKFDSPAVEIGFVIAVAP
jgi:hypothetical protein